jgi:protein CWC15
MRELEKIKKERAEAKAKEERERAAEEEEQREIDVARGNPLLNAKDFTMKRRWDDDVVFKNQARGTEDRNKKKEFINDMLRSDFHKKFMVCNIFTCIPSAFTNISSPNTYDELTSMHSLGATMNLAFSGYQSTRGHVSLHIAAMWMRGKQPQ